MTTMPTTSLTTTSWADEEEKAWQEAFEEESAKVFQHVTRGGLRCHYIFCSGGGPCAENSRRCRPYTLPVTKSSWESYLMHHVAINNTHKTAKLDVAYFCRSAEEIKTVAAVLQEKLVYQPQRQEHLDLLVATLPGHNQSCYQKHLALIATLKPVVEQLVNHPHPETLEFPQLSSSEYVLALKFSKIPRVNLSRALVSLVQKKNLIKI